MSGLTVPISAPSVLSTYSLAGTHVAILREGTEPLAIAARTLSGERYKNHTEAGCFFIVDLGIVREQYQQFVTEIPRATPFYAIKCNPNDMMISLLHELGAGFDCASIKEIRQVISRGASVDKIIYANPCKPPSHISAARDLGVNLMTADNVDEIYKIAKINPMAQIVIRIVADDRKAKWAFSSKFGARPAVWGEILHAIKETGLDMVGASFHVGSGSSDLEVYPKTLASVKRLFEQAATLGFNPHLVDIGGGFPGSAKWTPSFPDLAKGIREALDEYFPGPAYTIIAEPGRYFAERSHILVIRIIARRFSENNQEGNVLYYVDEGFYQAFNCIVNDHYTPEFKIFPKNTDGKVPNSFVEDVESRPTYKSTIFGPTCDSLDVLYKDMDLPLLEVGEWLVFPNMGAYTCSCAAPFNGYQCEDFLYVDTNAFCCSVKPKTTPALNLGEKVPLVRDSDDDLAPSGSEIESKARGEPAMHPLIIYLSETETDYNQ